MGFNLNDARILLGSKNLNPEFDNPRYSISPIMIENKNGELECLGTCFFISETGIFITAKHILESSFRDIKISEEHKNYIDEEFDSNKYLNINRGAYIPQFLPGNKFINRKILWTSMSSNDDVAIGVVGIATDNDGNKIKTIPLVLSARDAKVGDTLFTFAYPKSKKIAQDKFDLRPVNSLGKVNVEFPNGRDRVMIPNPCYETDIDTSCGSSGGPVFNLLGAVIGINTSGIDEKTHYVSKINNITEMRVPDGNLANMIQIKELMQKGIIKVYFWDSKGNDTTNVDYDYKILKYQKP